MPKRRASHLARIANGGLAEFLPSLVTLTHVPQARVGFDGIVYLTCL